MVLPANSSIFLIFSILYFSCFLATKYATAVLRLSIIFLLFMHFAQLAKTFGDAPSFLLATDDPCENSPCHAGA